MIRSLKTTNDETRQFRQGEATRSYLPHTPWASFLNSWVLSVDVVTVHSARHPSPIHSLSVPPTAHAIVATTCPIPPPRLPVHDRLSPWQTLGLIIRRTHAVPALAQQCFQPCAARSGLGAGLSITFHARLASITSRRDEAHRTNERHRGDD